MMVRDMRRLRTLVDKGPRCLTFEEGSLVANYARALTMVARARKRPAGLGDKTQEELLAMALEIPELRAMLGAQT